MENIIRQGLIVIFLTSQIYALPQRLEELAKNLTLKFDELILSIPTECDLDLEEIKHSLKQIAYR
jgi:hypothetical protein